jgi:hypothetical protein
MVLDRGTTAGGIAEGVIVIIACVIVIIATEDNCISLCISLFGAVIARYNIHRCTDNRG